MWQSKDAEILARASAITPTTQQSIETTTPETTKPSNTSESTGISPPSDGLSTGAKIGVSVGIPFVVIIGLALGFFFWKRRRTRQTVCEQHKVNAENKITLVAPMYLEGEQIHELHGAPKAHHSRHELPGMVHQY
jgi:uncharacterized protein HemX